MHSKKEGWCVAWDYYFSPGQFVRAYQSSNTSGRITIKDINCMKLKSFSSSNYPSNFGVKNGLFLFILKKRYHFNKLMMMIDIL